MNSTFFVFAISIALTAVTVFADALIKNASLQKSFSGWQSLLLGAIIYGLTAFGWFFITRKATLSKLGVLYALSTVILLTLVSVFYFKEKITTMEIGGIILAIISIIILFRFA
jgi:drug/metabolite transporter (DMT)-like permease